MKALIGTCPLCQNWLTHPNHDETIQTKCECPHCKTEFILHPRNSDGNIVTVIISQGNVMDIQGTPVTPDDIIFGKRVICKTHAF